MESTGSWGEEAVEGGKAVITFLLLLFADIDYQSSKYLYLIPDAPLSANSLILLKPSFTISGHFASTSWKSYKEKKKEFIQLSKYKNNTA